MKHLAAYLLLNLAGNANPTEKDITDVLSSVGVEVDAERLTALLAQLKDKDINELIAEGNTKLASVPSGGAASGGAPSGSAAAAGGDAPAAEEKAESEKEESDEDMGFGLFD